MFGYIRVYTPDLRVSEYETYKSAYCGFCKQLGRDYGQLWRFTLSYDFAFVKLLLEGLKEGKVTACKKRCIAHPFHKRYCMACDDSDRLLSAAAVLLSSAKIADNIEDSRFFGRLFWKFIAFITGFSVRKAARDFPLLVQAAGDLTKAQKQAEHHEQVTRDRAADPTGQMMALFFEQLSPDAVQKRILHELGYQIGRYVYFIDALDDLEKDKKKGNFNPFLLGMHREWSQQKQEIKAGALATINRCIGGAIEAYELLEIHHMKKILDNILYFGLQTTAKTVSEKEKKQTQQEMEIN